MFFRNIFIVLLLILTIACGGGSSSSSGTETGSPNQQGNDNSNSNTNDNSNTSVSNSNTNDNTPVTNNSNQNNNTVTNSNSNTADNTNSNTSTNSNTNNSNTNQNNNSTNTNSNSNDNGSNNPPLVALNDLCQENTLEELIGCIRDFIPTNQDHPSNDTGDKNEHEIPTDEVLNQFSGVIQSIFNGECDQIDLPSLIAERYMVKTFTDQSNGTNYCLMYEVVDNNTNAKVDKGWGTFIFNPNFSRSIDIQIPHPIDDNGTAHQGIVIFKEANARFFQMAGTRRNASLNPSLCQNEYSETDVAHNLQNLFQIAHQQSVNFYESNQLNNYVIFQFHKIASTTCSINNDPNHTDSADIFLTYGLNEPIPNGSPLAELINALWIKNSLWKIQSPSQNPSQCDKFGSNNTQSRYVNGVAPTNLCLQDADNITEHFIHVEQKNSYLDNEGKNTDEFFNPIFWIESIKSEFPEN